MQPSSIFKAQSYLAPVNEEVKYPCRECNYRPTEKGRLKKHQRAVHGRVEYPSSDATLKHFQREIPFGTKDHYIYESNTLAGNATMKQLKREVFRGTKEQYIKESNTLACNATIKHLQREILHDTKGQYMKESNTLADSVQNNSRKSQVLENMKKKYMKESSVP